MTLTTQKRRLLAWWKNGHCQTSKAHKSKWVVTCLLVSNELAVQVTLTRAGFCMQLGMQIGIILLQELQTCSCRDCAHELYHFLRHECRKLADESCSLGFLCAFPMSTTACGKLGNKSCHTMVSFERQLAIFSSFSMMRQRKNDVLHKHNWTRPKKPLPKCNHG